jgi:GTP-binding protein
MQPSDPNQVPLQVVARYVGTYVKTEDTPADGRPEFAFVGRSNVGKSSLINMLVGEKDLARVSQTPGKTQTLNYYLVNDNWYLVDLPGYGYARVSKVLRSQWEKMLSYYLRNRAPLRTLFVLLDSNVPPQKSDMAFLEKMASWRIPFSVVLTKTDRLNQKTRIQQMRLYEEALGELFDPKPNIFTSSAVRGFGRRDLIDYIETISQQGA